MSFTGCRKMGMLMVNGIKNNKNGLNNRRGRDEER